MPVPVSSTAWMTAAGDVQPAYDGDWTSVSAKADYWLTKILGRARTVAPCLKTAETLPDEVQESAKGIIVGAVLRKLDDATGGRQYEAAGPFSVNTDTKLRSDRLLTVADRDELRQLCRTVSRRRRGGTIRTPIGY